MSDNVHSFIHKCLLTALSMPGSVLGSRDVLVSKRTKIPVLRIYILFTVEPTEKTQTCSGGNGLTSDSDKCCEGNEPVEYGQ